MGDRAIIEFRFKQKGRGKATTSKLYLYTHWQGSRAAAAAERAAASVEAQSRVSDQSYYARIVMQQVMRELGMSPDSTTGAGLSPFLHDHDNSDHGVVGVIDCSAGTWTRAAS